MSAEANTTQHSDGDHHGIAHVMPLPILFGVGFLLLFLTGVTVWVTQADLGRSGNLIIAMVIATIKAGMVCMYFMHLRWDKAFHSLLVVISLLFVSLFIVMTLLDKSEYEQDIQEMYLLEGK